MAEAAEAVGGDHREGRAVSAADAQCDFLFCFRCAIRGRSPRGAVSAARGQRRWRPSFSFSPFHFPPALRWKSEKSSEGVSEGAPGLPGVSPAPPGGVPDAPQAAGTSKRRRRRKRKHLLALPCLCRPASHRRPQPEPEPEPGPRPEPYPKPNAEPAASRARAGAGATPQP